MDRERVAISIKCFIDYGYKETFDTVSDPKNNP